MNNKLYVFPLLKKSSQELTEEVEQSEIDEFVMHYMSQLLNHIENHGMELNEKFLKDFEFTSEVMRATMMRSMGKYHWIHDFIDDLEEKLNQGNEAEVEEE